ncbi:MAG: AAA family ATPase, partial [Phycisphaerales bacterium]|nr:AAA family ATPase [Phycisphaerales bacterium]
MSNPQSPPRNPTRPQPAGGAPGNTGPTVSLDPIKLLQKYKWALAASILVGAVAGVVAHIGFSKFAPKYTSFAVFQCNPVGEEIGEVNPAIVNPEEMERFIGTQVANMKSEQIIALVVRDSRIINEAPQWTKQFMRNGVFDTVEANAELQKIVQAYPVQNTYLIKIALSVRNPNDAAGLVKLVRLNYLDMINSNNSRNVIQRKKVISDAIDRASKEIKNLNTRRTRLVRDGSLDSLDSAKSSRAMKLRLIDTSLVDIQQTLEALAVMQVADETSLQRESGVDYTESLREEVEQNPLIRGLIQDKKRSETSLLSLQADGFGPQHRDVVRLISGIAALERKIEDTREEFLRKAFEARVQGTRMTINQYRAQESDLLKQHEELKDELTELTSISGEIKDIDHQILVTVELQSNHANDLAKLNTASSLDSASRVVVFAQETIPDRQSFPVIFTMVPAGVFVVGALTVGFILLFEFLDQRVKSAADIAMIPRTRPLGIIPDTCEDPANPTCAETVFRDSPTSVLAEHYRQLRTKIGNDLLRKQHRSLLVVGAMPGSGATSVTINLACACAARGQKTLIIDTNHRRPSIHSALGLNSDRGLADVLAGDNTLEECIQSTGERSPDVLAVGSLPHRIIERLGTDAMGDLIKQVSERYEIVLIDTSPAIVSGDAAMLANQTDASMLVVRAMAEKRG